MAAIKTSFFCRNCGAQSAKWIGKCPSCGEWNTYDQEVVQRPSAKKTGSVKSSPAKATSISKVESTVRGRIETYDTELNRTLGGGIVPGSLVLLGGEPGIGKSTLLLQLVLHMKSLRTLYVSGEESAAQIRMRAERIGITNEDCYILTETSTELILHQAGELQPSLLIIDSIQTLQTELIDSPAGSVSQVRECTAQLQRYAKESEVPVFLIGHITKEGTLAGPKMLEHMVDTVLQFEGDPHYAYRILRTLKNRFGATSELGIYEMIGEGLRPVTNPSDILLTRREEMLSGVSIAAAMEGQRPLLIETQALVSPAVFGTPQRTATGFDQRRLSMLLAVLDKRLGFAFGAKDVFLNLAGGLRLDDPALDLAIVSALASSHEDIPLKPNQCFAAEVGLTGEVRSVNRLEQRIAEADRLGFEKIFVSGFQSSSINTKRYKIEVKALNKVEEVVRAIL